MNEQIKAIGRQAGLVFIEDGVYGQRWYSSRCGLDAVEYEKLVELIVAECTAVLFDESERLSGLYSEENNMRLAQEHEIGSNQCIDNIELIEKHFGVEQ